MSADERLEQLRTEYRTVRAEPDEGSPIHRMRLDEHADRVAREIAELVCGDEFALPRAVLA